mmetsp:Transcript_22613/g.26091  ORF Transcript_22613/g.26091 Transcript_22613/m.26091 type:complete len:233 (+) Transcript_22613:768-1466(+)
MNVIKHPEFEIRTYVHDVAVFILNGASTVPVVKLLSSQSLSSSFRLEYPQELTVMGWGTTSHEGLTSTTLLQTNVIVWDDEDCESANEGKEGSVNRIGAWNFCANGIGPARDGCQGDSGGPIILRRAVSNHSSTHHNIGSSGAADTREDFEDVQVGIVSWGIECARPEYPGVYTNISHEYDWINEQVCTHNDYFCNNIATNKIIDYSDNYDPSDLIEVAAKEDIQKNPVKMR